MIKKQNIWPVYLVVFLGAFLVLFRAYWVGAVAEEYLGRLLTDVFGMPITIVNMTADPLTGAVSMSRLRFSNPKGYSERPHFDIQGVDFRVNVGALFRKQIRIREVVFNRPNYYMEQIAFPDGASRTNVRTWINHIKARNKDSTPEPESDTPGWTLQIDRMVLRDGEFVYEDKSVKEGGVKLVFQNITGELVGFKWPPRDRTVLEQTVRLTGTYGEHYPAPCVIQGVTNFASNMFNFDLKGWVPEGNATDHPYFWGGLPITVKDGRFRLDLHAVCREDMLHAQSLLTFKSLKVVPFHSVGGTIWGVPVMAWIGFVEKEKTFSLNVPVEGDIADPQFHFEEACREAFQEAMKRYTHATFRLITETPGKLAAHTQELAEKAPGKLVEGLEKLTDMVKDTALGAKGKLSDGE